MEQLNYNHLYYFHVVAEHGTISEASRRLGVTKPTVSNQIRLLETFLGRRLFDRRNGRLHLNADGRLVQKYTTQMFEYGRKILNHFKGIDPKPLATVRIGVGTPVARTLASDFFAPIVALDDLRPSIRVGDLERLRSQLLGYEVDLVLTDVSIPDATELGLREQLLAESPLVLIANSELAIEEGDVDGALGAHPIVQYFADVSARWKIEEYATARGIELTTGSITDDIPTMISLVAASPMIAAVPQVATRMATEAGALTIVGPLASLQSRVYGLFMDRDAPRLVERAVNALRRVGDGPANGAAGATELF